MRKEYLEADWEIFPWGTVYMHKMLHLEATGKPWVPTRFSVYHKGERLFTGSEEECKEFRDAKKDN